METPFPDTKRKSLKKQMAGKAFYREGTLVWRQENGSVGEDARTEAPAPRVSGTGDRLTKAALTKAALPQAPSSGGSGNISREAGREEQGLVGPG